VKLATGSKRGPKSRRKSRPKEGDEGPSTVAEQLAARLPGDEADLFLAYHRQLVKNVDDACAFA
jgi:hypothetical protein